MKGPYYVDGCCHLNNRGNYCGSTEVEGIKYDVYSYPDHKRPDGTWETHLCFRYGSKGPEYISPGTSEMVEAVIGRLEKDSGLWAVYSECLSMYQQKTIQREIKPQ